MSLTTCTIMVSQQAGRAVGLSRPLIKALALGSAKTVTLKLGSKSASVPVKPLNRQGNVLVLPSSLHAQLRPPRLGKVLVKSSGSKEIQLGPLIGILANTSNNSESPFGTRTSFIKELMHTSDNRAFHVAFSPGQVNWQSGEVTGYVLSGEGRLVRKTVPLPDVVYNRLSSRRAEKTSSMEGFKDRFVRRRIPLFNWSFFEKWDVYRLLDGESEANKHVPESYINPSPDTIKNMMEKHRFIFLKPTNGSLGIGIYRLTYNPKRGYFARFRRGGTNSLIRFPRFDGLMKLLRRHGIRLQNYVVQQGIRLMELDNCPIDFRFHMTKNGNNQWVAAGIGAKKAGRGSVTTHVRTGGQLMTPENALTRIFGASKGEQLLDDAKSVAVKLCQAIERNYPHPLGELGLDLGIDQNERVWMFEANSKPGRSIFKHPALKAQGRASINHIFEHCLFLSRFRSRREG